MSIRCRLGRHDYIPLTPVCEQVNAWTRTWTNALCRRCLRRIWLNWPSSSGVCWHPGRNNVSVIRWLREPVSVPIPRFGIGVICAYGVLAITAFVYIVAESVS
jgi:hypothetical protein